MSEPAPTPTPTLQPAATHRIISVQLHAQVVKLLARAPLSWEETNPLLELLMSAPGFIPDA